MNTKTFTHVDTVGVAANILSAYVQKHFVPASELPDLLVRIHSTVVDISFLQSSPDIKINFHDTRVLPAQVRKSITPEALISFVDGKPYKTLKRHLSTHGLDFEGYRARYGLPADYPTVAADYAAKRSALAKSFGLGRPGGRKA